MMRISVLGYVSDDNKEHSCINALMCTPETAEIISLCEYK